jgi:hypothetical protein
MHLLKIFSIGLLGFSIASPVFAGELPEPPKMEREIAMLYVLDALTQPHQQEGLGVLVVRRIRIHPEDAEEFCDSYCFYRNTHERLHGLQRID